MKGNLYYVLSCGDSFVGKEGLVVGMCFNVELNLEYAATLM